ncbi:MAG: acyl-CoA desaturase [Sphingobacteriaceae bacterium]|nr:MAG: acyl-CoA desaturase [Sphingobacteriaceae bacterium]
MSKISFNNAGSPFFKSLKGKINTYFTENQLSRTGGSRLFLKGLFISAVTLGLYITLVFFTPSTLPAILLCCLFGASLAAIGFNIMHEGGHQSFSKYKWINELSAYSLNCLGGTIHFWKQKHNIDHHTYTNIDGMDHDISVKFMRMSKEQPKYWYHKFQQFYWVLLYGVSYIAWILYQDFEKYFSGKMGQASKVMKLSTKEHLIFWTTKTCYIFFYIILPVIMVGWADALLGFVIAAVVCGFCISVVFQLAHAVEETNFPVPCVETNKIEEEWAIHQISTTANFATRNKVISWFLGGLNFQVEHHLFPGISHIHYPQINKLVKETCTEFNVAYFEHRTMVQAFFSHLVYIKKLGQTA